MTWLNFSEACARNQAAILARLAPLLNQSQRVLEIGSGSGQHAVHFCQALSHLRWQPTDLSANLPALNANLLHFGSENIQTAAMLDVNVDDWPGTGYDAVYTANTLHIIAWGEVMALFRGAGRVLEPGGLLCVYGPFRYAGQYTSASNAEFDRWLGLRDPHSGIRDFEALDLLATQQGLTLEHDWAMPANNQLLVWRRLPVSA